MPVKSLLSEVGSTAGNYMEEVMSAYLTSSKDIVDAHTAGKNFEQDLIIVLRQIRDELAEANGIGNSVIFYKRLNDGSLLDRADICPTKAANNLD